MASATAAYGGLKAAMWQLNRKMLAPAGLGRSRTSPSVVGEAAKSLIHPEPGAPWTLLAQGLPDWTLIVLLGALLG